MGCYFFRFKINLVMWTVEQSEGGMLENLSLYWSVTFSIVGLKAKGYFRWGFIFLCLISCD